VAFNASTIEITEMDETTRRWTDVTRTGFYQGTKGMWQVLAEEGGSQVRLTAEMHAQGPGRLLLPLIDKWAKKELEAEFENLKKALESGS
jgi:hypothetical protein